MLGQLNECKPFRSTGKGGGSKKGKPQGKWPWPIKVAADAVFCCVKGGIEAWLKDRRKIISTEEFMRRMDVALPGWKAVAKQALGPRATCYGKLLENRVYEMVEPFPG